MRTFARTRYASQTCSEDYVIGTDVENWTTMEEVHASIWIVVFTVALLLSVLALGKMFTLSFVQICIWLKLQFTCGKIEYYFYIRQCDDPMNLDKGNIEPPLFDLLTINIETKQDRTTPVVSADDDAQHALKCIQSVNHKLHILYWFCQGI